MRLRGGKAAKDRGKKRLFVFAASLSGPYPPLMRKLNDPPLFGTPADSMNKASCSCSDQ